MPFVKKSSVLKVAEDKEKVAVKKFHEEIDKKLPKYVEGEVICITIPDPDISEESLADIVKELQDDEWNAVVFSTGDGDRMLNIS